MFREIKNQKGFAISTLLYGMTIVGVLVMGIIVSLSFFSSQSNYNFIKNVENNLNSYADSTFYNQQCPKRLLDTIRENAVLDNVSSSFVSSSSGINFSLGFSNTNGNGIYKFAGSNSSYLYPIYYYRGSVTNNNVVFANFCWKIVRTTEDGGIKLLYSGKPDSSGRCIPKSTSDLSIGDNDFNSAGYKLITANGYMMGGNLNTLMKKQSMKNDTSKITYGSGFTYSNGTYTLTDTIQSEDWNSDYKKIASKYHYTCNITASSCNYARFRYIYNITNDSYKYFSYNSINKDVNIDSRVSAMRENKSNSDIKKKIDSWYSSNLDSYTDMLEDSKWCNERRFENNNNGLSASGDAMVSTINYTSFNRKTPNFDCNNEKNDIYTVDNTSGNGALTYPIGLLTMDEVRLLGVVEGSNPFLNSYLNSFYNGNWLISSFWTMTPSFIDLSLGQSYQFVAGKSYPGVLSTLSTSDSSIAIRPAIVLKSDTYYSLGDGSSEKPYVINKK